MNLPAAASDACLVPIPPLVEPPNWARLPIEECGEPLIALTNGEGNIFVRALYAEQNIPGAPTTIWVRSGVRDRLFVAAQTLPPGVSLVVFDGHRPLMVQRFLWDSFYNEIARARPELTDEAVTAQTAQFVASPSADPSCPPPHRTGGAVDVYLVETAEQEPLPMGTEPDETVDESATRFYEEATETPYNRTFALKAFRENRRLLFHAMVGAGFTNYRGEWWHFDFGNQRWANCSGAGRAIYGIAAEPVATAA